jgi:hypothetical protein
MKVAQGAGGRAAVWCSQKGNALAQTDYFVIGRERYQSLSRRGGRRRV